LGASPSKVPEVCQVFPPSMLYSRPSTAEISTCRSVLLTRTGALGTATESDAAFVRTLRAAEAGLGMVSSVSAYRAVMLYTVLFHRICRIAEPVSLVEWNPLQMGDDGSPQLVLGEQADRKLIASHNGVGLFWEARFFQF